MQSPLVLKKQKRVKLVLSVCKLKKAIEETEDEKFQIILDKQEEVQ
ncbi:hypothetical protein ACQKND_17010 [Viridibacillus arvi]